LANGLIIGAPRSGSGKTLVTLGLLAALKARGIGVTPAKTGPDYIDRTILARAAGAEAINLDPWAMKLDRLRSVASAHATGADLLLVEGVMGLFDGAADGAGSTGDLAAALGLPVVLVVDADKQSQSVAALVSGFANWRKDVVVTGVILNGVATTRHEAMLSRAIAQTAVPLLGALPRRETLTLPERHLGLVLPSEVDGFEAVVDEAAEAVSEYVDLNRLLALSKPLNSATGELHRLQPLGQRIAVARDDAFAFVYPHWVADWRDAGAEISFFSPLADEPPDAASDAVFLPGGYPELHGATLARASRFKAGLAGARDRGALIYGECGGYMVLGQTLTDKEGSTHEMAGLLPVETRIDRPRRSLGYRRLAHGGELPFPRDLLGHEFHYSSERSRSGPTLFAAADAEGTVLPPMGAVSGRVMGSYAHVIDAA
jgi:cobyrinic acid a,c-diamide synthase